MFLEIPNMTKNQKTKAKQMINKHFSLFHKKPAAKPCQALRQVLNQVYVMR